MASPNVIVIMTDDQGYGEFSCHGNPVVETPHIDRLAAGSVRLTDFHVAPMCTPTRGQLMTGLDAFRNGAVNVSSGRTLMRPELKTIADVFRSAGYRTGIFGKWHLGDNYPFRPEDRGFDEAVWFRSSHINSTPDHWDNDYFDDTYIHNGQPERYSGYCTDVFFNQASQWIGSEDSDKPFFAYIALNAAHWPWFVPDHYRQPIRDSLANHPEITKKLNANQIESLVSFLAMGTSIDDNVGKLDSFLTDHALLDNTIVVFLTDNGSTMGKDYFNAGMRGSKTQLWEGGHRVPCFVRWPAGNLAMGEIDELSQVQDLLPTLAELAGITNVPAHLDGQSLAAIMRGQPSTLGDRKLVINYSRMPQFKVEYTDQNPSVPHRDGAGVLWKNWRLLENRELYDVAADPHQDHDVAADNPDVVRELSTHLDDWWNGVKRDALAVQRVVIGSDAENPAMLTACEWLDVFVDQQIQIRRGVQKNGVWHLSVAQAGTYDVELRRWPRESKLRLDQGCRRTVVTDGVFVPGKVLPITQGRIRLGKHTFPIQPAAEDGLSIQFTADLLAGETELETWMLDDAGQEICGAYYVYVKRR
ncbi:arylsulfatase [Stieleria sp. TO1_6]|uniref:arylsulfatase n=1 Tax=Stieleria tagensis TaxID=2956795 RepID=UPI00209A82E1|nr:arylsulfatase [Stieleria tagensis]MCO8124771.1 arylsulfatase [Stieleria tagensis]